jgi:ABC-type glutathione transport system ATPase component
LRRGEVLALVGESGSGKSTLAKILVGALKPTGGDIDELELAQGAGRKERSRHVQMVFQDPYSSLNPRISVGSMLAGLLRLHRVVPSGEVRAESIRLLNRVGLQEDALQAYPSQFSGGQRQRLAIARAVLLEPAILLLDDPTAAIDSETEHEIFEALDRAIAGRTTFIVAHRLSTLRRADRIIVMEGGRIVQHGTHAELMRVPGPYLHVARLQLVDGREWEGAA